MKSRIIITIFSLILVINLSAQKKSKSNEGFENSYQKYKNAMKYLDYNTAITALHEILIIAPEKTVFKDSLLAIYFNSGNATSAVLLAKDLEAEGNTKASTYEVLALTYQNAGLLKESLAYYEKLNTKEEKLFYLYQIATIQFNMSRLKECSQTLAKIIGNAEASKQTIKIDYEKQAPQNVPYSAAAYNILGVLNLQIKEKEQALKNFNQSLTIYPEFILAKNNLELATKNK